MLQVVTEWTGPQGAGLLNIMHFAATDPAESGPIRAALADFFGGLDGVVSNQYRWDIQTSGKILDPLTGTLVGLWSETTPYGAPGAQSQQPVADATQVLVQWLTLRVLDGRLVRGRQFIPGLANGSLANGNLTSGVRAALGEVASDLVGADVGFGIWTRPRPARANPPRPARAGSFTPVAAGSVWSELAVQRGRRA